jgi:hypothetical protein
MKSPFKVAGWGLSSPFIEDDKDQPQSGRNSNSNEFNSGKNSSGNLSNTYRSSQLINFN